MTDIASVSFAIIQMRERDIKMMGLKEVEKERVRGRTRERERECGWKGNSSACAI